MLNGLADAATLIEGDITSPGATVGGAPFDVILANLTGAMLTRNASALATLAAPGAHLVASGFREDEVPVVLDAFRTARWRLVDRSIDRGWVGALARQTHPEGQLT